MTDNFSGGLGSTKQEKNILKEASKRYKAQSMHGFMDDDNEGDKKKKPEKDVPRVSEMYKEGIRALENYGFMVELDEMGEHVNHRVYQSTEPPAIDGITYPKDFKPLQEIHTMTDFERLEHAFSICDKDAREFWQAFYKPVGGDNPLLSMTQRMLKMKKAEQAQNLHKVLNYGHTFDPAGRLGGQKVNTPRIWVPDRSWFNPVLYKVTFGDVFSIFPRAEQEMLCLLLGRVGVGRNNHLPPGFTDPVSHTARMAGVIIGKDAGLGKSTIFNGLTAALQKCGFVTHTFRTTEDRFGLKAAALSDIAYKDDTSLSSLKKFLASEETKTLITGGLFQVEEKFEKAEQIWPKTVILVNANDWEAKFAYDLDPGIIDRIKIISTYREYEVIKLRDQLKGSVSEGTPDLRPHAHLPYLANKLGVSIDALYLWCLRLATDRFWKIINDREDPTINRLQVEVRYWTTRQRIRFKADVTQALVNGMAFAWLLRTKNQTVPELTPAILQECLQHFYFLGVDPSGLELMNKMKENWTASGRPSTHYYQGFREIRWESVRKAAYYYENYACNTDQLTAAEVLKEMMQRLVMRDGHKIGATANYLIEDWNTMRFACEELQLEGEKLLEECDVKDKKRLANVNQSPEDKWLKNEKYSPDSAEIFRSEARKKLYQIAE